jgi:pimeloyl-ACP methyl ester carboxylesterase
MRHDVVLLIGMLGLWAVSLPSSAEMPPAPLTFEQTPPPSAPDYSQASAWALRPVGPAQNGPGKTMGVDVFYVHPTTFGGEAWNQDTADAAANALTDSTVIRTQASAFGTCCRLFAPRYRQASGKAFASQYGQGALAYDLAYGDVARAFEVYLREDNNGRPFILAGHSQGALHILRLLEERLDGRPEQARLVAAYVVGIGVSRGEFGKGLKHIPACDRRRQTGCVVSWNTFEDGSDAGAYIAQSETRFTRRFGDTPDKALVCMNPLTFEADLPGAGVERHLGAVAGTRGGALPPPIEHAVAARCEGGVLRARAPGGKVTLNPLPNGSLHMQDIELFWGNIRADAQERSASMLQAIARRAP